MKVINAGYEILTKFDGHELERIEKIARVCYKSEDKITEDSANTFVAGLIKRGHEAMLEHGSISVKFICDRGISHDLVRHRLASFGQESTRCNYSKDKFGRELTFIKPYFFGDEGEEYQIWKDAMLADELAYLSLINIGRAPLEARSVLPNSLKTEVIMTANYREWRHFFNLRACRATGPAHPQMEEITVPLLLELNDRIPVIFTDLKLKAMEVRISATKGIQSA